MIGSLPYPFAAEQAPAKGCISLGAVFDGVGAESLLSAPPCGFHFPRVLGKQAAASCVVLRIVLVPDKGRQSARQQAGVVTPDFTDEGHSLPLSPWLEVGITPELTFDVHPFPTAVSSVVKYLGVREVFRSTMMTWSLVRCVRTKSGRPRIFAPPIVNVGASKTVSSGSENATP